MLSEEELFYDPDFKSQNPSEIKDKNASDSKSYLKRWRCCNYRWWCNPINRYRWKVLFYLSFLFVWIPLYIFSYPDLNNNYVYPYSPTNDDLGKDQFTLVLFGDSLLNVPCTYYNMIEKIQHMYPDYNLNIVNQGVNGNKIADMLARIYPDVVDLVPKPDAVIVYWDSDVSDDSVGILNAYQTQEQYEADLSQVIRILLNVTSRVAISGPGILGERPLFPSPGPAVSYFEKHTLLNYYREINQNISSYFQVPYIDMRAAIMDQIPPGWALARWYITIDGEHPNERGTRLEARMFCDMLNRWLNL